MNEVNINCDDKGQRLDKFLLKYFNKAPKSFIYKMLRKKRIKLNGKRAEGNEILKGGDTLQMYLSEDTIATMQEVKSIAKVIKEFDVIYEDDKLILVNKPVGLLVQPDSGSESNSLNDQLLYYLYEKGEYDISKEASFKPGVANRLDRNTSGIVAMGKNLSMTQALSNAFKNDGIEKYYLTVVKGELDKSGRLEAYHLKNEDNTVKILKEPVGNAKKVATEYKPLYTKDGYTILEIKLITGRTHQIRASLQYIGYPVIGDRKYGDTMTNRLFRDKYNLNNQLLHAYKLIVKADNGELAYLSGKEFLAPVGGVMKRVIDDLK